jgi:hypothetical protein
MPVVRRSKEAQKRIEAEAAEEALALEAIEAEGLAEVETIGRAWDLAPEEIEIVLKGKYLPLYIRARQAQRDIARRGLISTDHYGRSRTNPSVTIEKDSIQAMARLLKLLNIGLNEPPEPGPNDRPRPWSKQR